MTLRLLLIECWTCFAADSEPLICLQTHLPGYVSDYSKLGEAGAQVIACVSVNDAFVMKAWGEQSGAEAKVRLSHLMNPQVYGKQEASMLWHRLVSPRFDRFACRVFACWLTLMESWPRP